MCNAEPDTCCALKDGEHNAPPKAMEKRTIGGTLPKARELKGLAGINTLTLFISGVDATSDVLK